MYMFLLLKMQHFFICIFLKKLVDSVNTFIYILPMQNEMPHRVGGRINSSDELLGRGGFRESHIKQTEQI